MLTPKSLLRHPLVASTPRELAEGRFRMVLAGRGGRGARAETCAACSSARGKVYVDLIASEHRAARPDIAICRLEQLYPVPMRDLRAMLDALPERGGNRLGAGGAGEHGGVGFHPAAPAGGAGGRTVRRVARPRSASPAEGSAARHALNQQALVDQAFGDPGGPRADGDLPGQRADNLQKGSGGGGIVTAFETNYVRSVLLNWGRCVTRHRRP